MNLEDIKKILNQKNPPFSDFNEYRYGIKDDRYFLDKPLEEVRLLGIEAYFGITFPEQYRNFILNIGNGGAGPGYGLSSFDMSLVDLGRLMYDKDLGIPFHKYIAEPFKLINDDWNAPGLWPICNFGCARYDFIVISGVERGNIWTFVDNCGLFPKESPDFNSDYSLEMYSKNWLSEIRSEKNTYRMSFNEWYESWLYKTN